MAALQPMWLRKEEIPALPDGWKALQTSEVTVQLKSGKLFETRTVAETGLIPVLSQGESGFIGYHDEMPGVMASPSIPVVTFANHTCAMRLMKRPFSCIQNIFPKIGRKGVCDTVYFYYAALGRVTISDYKGHHPLFRQTYIPIPPLSTQAKIAAILSAYDDLIENNLQRIKILEEMAQNLYHEWFVRFRFLGHQHACFTDSLLGRIPQEWGCGVVNDLVSLKSGFAFRSSTFIEDGAYGLVTIRNVHDGLFVPDCTNRIADLPSNMSDFCHLSTGDVLLSLTGNIGRVCLVYGTNYLLNQRVAKLVPNEVNNRTYVYLTFRQDEFQTKLSKIANGVAQQNLSPIETGKTQVVIPSQKVLADFAGICEPIVKEMTVLFQENATLRRTRDLLLPRLISGELDVSELDIAVPEEAMA